MFGFKKSALAVVLVFSLVQLTGCGAMLYGDPIDRADRNALALAPRSVSTDFNESEAKRAMGVGEVEVKSVLVSCYGRGMLCMSGSAPIANVKVWLYPYTAYFAEYHRMQMKLNADIKRNPKYQKVEIPLDQRMGKYRLEAKTDQYGRYSFLKLLPGKYFVISEDYMANRPRVGHYYDQYGMDHPRQVTEPARLEFSSIIEISQNSGVYKFESEMKIGALYAFQ